MKGTIFSVEEFSVYDGPGIRTTVFFTGCPLRCNWCHNPEGLERRPRIVRTKQGCLECGRCEAVCAHPGDCRLCGSCVNACPLRLIAFSSDTVEAEALADRIAKNGKILTASGGGVTFSGGEALMQADFLFEMLELTKPLHRAVATSGHAASDVFERAAASCDLILMDIKMVDPERHKRYTGVDNGLILSNFERLRNGATPFIIRIPLIPGVNDDDENMTATASLLMGSPCLHSVELLPYNKAAGAKYARMGMAYEPVFDESKAPKASAGIFESMGIKCAIL